MREAVIMYRAKQRAHWDHTCALIATIIKVVSPNAQLDNLNPYADDRNAGSDDADALWSAIERTRLITDPDVRARALASVLRAYGRPEKS